jgi:hypothetical protein
LRIKIQQMIYSQIFHHIVFSFRKKKSLLLLLLLVLLFLSYNISESNIIYCQTDQGTMVLASMDIEKWVAPDIMALPFKSHTYIRMMNI